MKMLHRVVTVMNQQIMKLMYVSLVFQGSKLRAKGRH